MISIKMEMVAISFVKKKKDGLAMKEFLIFVHQFVEMEYL